MNLDEINEAVETAESDQVEARMRFWQYVSSIYDMSYPRSRFMSDEGIVYIYFTSDEVIEFSNSEIATFSAQMKAEGLLELDSETVRERMKSEMPMGMSLVGGSILGEPILDGCNDSFLPP
ncbi:MAG: hypothetical protein O7E52_23980, partial [Candidatus Poribacteria bacterium]|nr:hypothetical protein [Candidatus Poribacteria bacterium]